VLGFRGKSSLIDLIKEQASHLPVTAIWCGFGPDSDAGELSFAVKTQLHSSSI